jgi:hypothetical protein
MHGFWGPPRNQVGFAHKLLKSLSTNHRYETVTGRFTERFSDLHYAGALGDFRGASTNPVELVWRQRMKSG